MVRYGPEMFGDLTAKATRPRRSGISSCPTRFCCRSFGTSQIQTLCVLLGTRMEGGDDGGTPGFKCSCQLVAVDFAQFLFPSPD